MKHGILVDSYVNGTTLSDEQIIIPFVAPLSVTSNQPAYAQDTANLKRRASSQKVQRWEITTNLMPSNSDALSMIHAVSNGVFRKFLVSMPQVHGLEAASTSATASNALRGTSVLSTNVNVASGEFINIGINPKVYLVTASTANTMTISPALVAPITSVETGRVRRGRQTTALVRYDADTHIGISYVDGVLSDAGSVKLIEALE